jgi:hypothetical protein
MKSVPKITSVDVGSVAASGREKRAVTVRAQNQSHETLRILFSYPMRAVTRSRGNMVSREQRTSLVNFGVF